jgi:bacillithiol system protein YtxJ
MQLAPIAVIYKHSPVCGASAAAEQEVFRFVAMSPRVPVYRVDVIREPALSRRIAEGLDVTHASPQVILLRAGSPVWAVSHRGITAKALHGAVRGESGRASAETAGPGACSLRPNPQRA